jgi:peptidoglycan/xylan/chitin deacetylase (PgdA/CDA1 family)
VRRLLLGAAGTAASAHLLPSVLTIPALHRRLVRRLSGESVSAHVALTFDDGPDVASTPLFLDRLASLGVYATFFVLGSQVQAHPEVAKRIVADGHEIALHGWAHRAHLLRAPWLVGRDLERAQHLVVQVTGAQPRFWRPPNGIVTGAGLLAAHRLGLQPVLWTADGQDWSASATGASVAARIAGRLGAGGTVLLHDSDITSAPGSWRAALDAVPSVVGLCNERGWSVGPLRDHFPAAPR